MKKNLDGKYNGFSTYSEQDHHSQAKENFKILSQLLLEKIDADEIPRQAKVLDIGCATGALIHYLSTVFQDFSFEGIDISEELIGIAKTKVPNVNFRVGTLHTLPETGTDLFDVVLLFGVLGIFDDSDARDAIHRLTKLVRPGGYIYLFSQFNEFDVDVLIKHRLTNPSNYWADWESGWNIYSYRTIDNWLRDHVTEYKFIDFEIPITLAPQENPIRTWTIEMTNGGRKLTNGLKLLVDLKFLEIKV